MKREAVSITSTGHVADHGFLAVSLQVTLVTRSSATAEELCDALGQLKYD